MFLPEPATAVAGSYLVQALNQTWPPFTLIAGLLLVGAAAASDGLFATVGAALSRLPGGDLVVFGALMLLVAGVTVVANLDTSVVFLTPVVLHAARHRKVDETAYLFGVVFMSNAGSLLLPGSNLTNLLVIGHGQRSGSAYAATMLPAWLAAVTVTGIVVVVWRYRDFLPRRTPPSLPGAGPGAQPLAGPPPLASSARQAPRPAGHATGTAPGDSGQPARLGVGVIALVGALVLVLALTRPALPVLVLGLAAAGAQVFLGRTSAAAAARAVNVPLLAGLFVAATAIGAGARAWGGPEGFMASIGGWATAWVGVGTSSVINNLPAAVLLAPAPPVHPNALLVGLDLGPNLVVSGSLAAIFWYRIARAEGARPSAWTYSKVGALLVPLSVTAALLALGTWP